jgi:L-arabinose isomerase
VEVLALAPPELGIPRGYLRFAAPAAEAFDSWCEAGANHHAAFAPGHHTEALAAFADIFGIECLTVPP